MSDEPQLVRGKCAVDDRGTISFVNDFTFASVKRFYTVTNYRKGFVRAWHGHKHESKCCTAVCGSLLVCCILVDNWEHPSPNLSINRYVLSERTPDVLCIPAGYVNGFMSLTDDAKIMFFSTATLEESHGDDIRFPARQWDPWSVEER